MSEKIEIESTQQEQESLIDVEKEFHSEPKQEEKKPLSPYLQKLQKGIKNFNVPHHIKIDTIFDTIKDAHTIFAIEKKTYDFVLNLNKLLIALVVMLSILIISLFPLKEKEPYLIGFSNASQNFVHIERANETITTNEALIRSLIGAYIINRETINHFDDTERYEIIRTQSSYKVWKIFENIVAQEASVYGNTNLTRSVKVVNVAKWKNGYANAEVSISLYALGALQSQKRYKITLMYKFNTLDIDFESLPKNPTGFEVQEYAVTEIATIKELEDENKVNPRDSKSKIKLNEKAQTDSNDFLKEAYQFKEEKEKENQQAQKLDYKNLTPSERNKLLAEEVKAMKKAQEEKIKQEEAEKQQNNATSAEGLNSPNPFLD